MTPLVGFLKKILGAASTPASTPTDARAGVTRSRAPVDSRGGSAAGDRGPDDGGGERAGPRKRGSRGGRGRGRGAAAAAPEVGTPPAAEARESTSSRGGTRGRGRGAGAPNAAPASSASTGNAPTGTDSRGYSWSGRPGGDNTETEEQARQRREQASRQRRGGRPPSFRPYRENLDAPLPEDIAFRPGPEGGDRTILPSRRRRGTGLRDTERVIVGGARTLSGWSRPFVVPAEPNELPVQPDGERAGEHEAQAQPRPATTRARAPRVTPPAVALDEEDDLDGNIDARADALDDSPDAPGAVGIGETGDTTEDGEPRRRRRGRRGGRGRRRPDGAAEGGGDEAPPEDRTNEDDMDDRESASVELHAVPQGGEADDLDDFDAPIAAFDDEDETVGDAEPDDEPAAVEAAPGRAPRRAARAPRTLAAVDPSMLPQAFADLGGGERTLQALARYGFSTPTPIQERAVPALIAGRDVVGVAQTGSGKTIAFGVPMVEQLDPQLPEVQGLVLVPTRELASQVLEVLKDLAAGFGLEAVGILGGHSIAGDFKALERRPAIVVGTPGRVIDHLQRGTLSLRYVRYAVLDEADQMLDIGFLPDIRRILSRTPKRRQTALFSATMPSTIRRLIWQFMDDPETVTIDPELTTVESIDQVYFEVASRDKAKGLRELVERELKGRTLVFCKMKRGVDRLEGDLARQGVRVGALHGDMDQRRRDRVVQDFREGALDVLIATNVAARGLDIPEITHVVNYDVPQNPEEYVHRVGRTGRAGRGGKAITFVSEWDMREWDAILDAFGDRLHREELSIYSR